MSNDIQSTQRNIPIDCINNNRQTTSLQKGIFLGREVVQTDPKEREQNRANSKLELSETLSMLTSTELTNAMLSFEKDTNAAQSLFNRKVQVITPSRTVS